MGYNNDNYESVFLHSFPTSYFHFEAKTIKGNVPEFLMVDCIRKVKTDFFASVNDLKVSSET
jgi:hypothetical protein